MVRQMSKPPSDLRKRLASLIVEKIKQRGLSQSEAAAIFGVGQPRVSDLFQERLDRFSVEMLLLWLERLGEPVRINLLDGDNGGHSKPLRLLLVEDNDADATVLSECLANVVGISVYTERVRDLQSAIEHAKQTSFHVVLLDLNLPDSQGLPTLQAARAAIPNAIPIVVLTGLSEISVATSSLACGADNFLVKGGKNFGVLVASALIAALGHAG